MSDDPTEFLSEPIETGLFTATVNAVALVAEPRLNEADLTEEATQAAKALINLPDISAVELAQVAREIAQDIGMLPEVLRKHKLTQAHYEFLEKHNKFFKSVLETEIKNWQSIKSTEVRLRLQAQAALEQQMPVIANRMGNAAEKLGDAVEAAKLFARIAGVDAPANAPATPGERYAITIDLGADTRVVIGATTGAGAGAGSPAHGALQEDRQGRGDAAALRRDGQRRANLPALPAIPEG